MHLLHGLRPGPAARCLPQLRRRSCVPAGETHAPAGEISRLHEAGPQPQLRRCGLMRLRAVLFTSVLGLAACAAAPTAPSGPVLPKGPEHGRIENNAYYDQRDWYSVTLPFQPGEEGYDSLSVTEEYPGHVSYAAFIPAYTAGEYYRVYLEDFYATNQPVPDLATVADMAMRFFGKELLQERLEPVRLLEEKSWDTGNTTGYLRLYTEKAPIAPLLTNLAMAEDYTATILMYVTV